jgi:ribosomal protein S18 acetylase RimI-like enzyme
MSDHTYKLNNPVWYALTETQSRLSVPFDNLRFYQSDYCTFGAIYDVNEPYSGFQVYALQTENFYVVGYKPLLPDGFELIQEVICDQMVFERNPSNVLINEKEIFKLDNSHQKQLINLVNLVQPGYFRERTPEMGAFYGIFEGDQLVAAAGIRIQLNEYAEISSVVTHPNFLRKNYALMLTMHCTDKILKTGKTPFLHVLETNNGAIALYKKAGFEYRRKMVFWKIGMVD